MKIIWVERKLDSAERAILACTKKTWVERKWDSVEMGQF